MQEHKHYQRIFAACLELLHSAEESQTIADAIWSKHCFYLQKEGSNCLLDWINREVAGALVDRHSDRIFRFALKLTRDEDQALEVLQAVSLKILTKSHQFRGDNGSSFLGWASTIAANEVRQMRRKAARFEQLDETTKDVENVAVRTSTRQVQEEIFVEGILSVLKPSDRSLLLLRYQEGLATEEIAEMFDISETAVRIRLLRICRQVRDHPSHQVDKNARPYAPQKKASKDSTVLSAREFARQHKASQ
jgi:RNA polymerase sigma-70 factor (ECF subfamily)